MAEAQDVETLKRRGRRRLVGAVALVLAAVIVLPMLFDREPPQSPPEVSVRIPGENEAPFAPKPPPKAPKPQAVKPQPQAVQPPATQAEYVVQVGVFANPDNVMARLKAANVPYYTESMRDKLTRVRAGPFPSREAADKALEKIRKLGLEPGAVTAKSG